MLNSTGLPISKIQANETLAISVCVWKDGLTLITSSEDVLVRADGRISVPVLGDDGFSAAGLSSEVLKDAIEKRIRGLWRGPDINLKVIVEASQSYRVFVTGKVIKPGTITSEIPINVLQALKVTGGFQKSANPSDMTIISSDGKIVTKFSYDEILIKNPDTQDIPVLKSGDVVFVP
jgi:polysaccharide export outer membrane protein